YYRQMPVPPIVTAFRKGPETLIDLGADVDLNSKIFKKWRTEVAKAIDSREVRFVAGRTQISHKGNRILTVRAKPRRLDENWEKTGEFYTLDGLAGLIDRENVAPMAALVKQLRSSVGIVPFVGAGLSVAFGVFFWSGFLTAAAEFHDEPEKVLAEVKANNLIHAATLLAKDPDRFQGMVAHFFGVPIKTTGVRETAAARLPLLASGPVITTNFDSVLEQVFSHARAGFDRFITGAEPDHVIQVMH